MAKVHLVYLDIDTGYFPGVHHGLASLTAALRQGGHTVTFHHLSTDEPAEIVTGQALKNNPDIVGYSLVTDQRRYLGKYSNAVSEQSDVLQVAGGIHPTIDPMDVLNIGSIQGVCIGEGEWTFPNLLDKLDNRKLVFASEGFWWRNDEGKIEQNPVPPLDPDLSTLPYPDYSIFDVDAITRTSSGWMAMALIRGCPHNCSYCCNHVLRSIYPNKKDYVRIPRVEYAIGIIKHNLSFYPNVKGIIFADDLLIFDREWFKRFGERYRSEVGLPFACNARIEYLTEKNCMTLSKAGCVLALVGVESGNEWVRKNLLNRRYKNDQIIGVFRRLKHFGIQTFSYNMLGLPFETKRQMKDTLSLNRRIKPHMGAVFYFTPYPGTRLYSICKEFDLLNDSGEVSSGYLERPRIKLTHCKPKNCTKLYNKLRLYLLSRTATKNFRICSSFTAMLIYLLFQIYPSFFVRVFTKRSKFKSMVRKIMYDRLFRQHKVGT